MDSREFIESGALETYAMGLATEQEAKLVVEMVARYPEVKAELMSIEDAMEKFDQKNAVQPPAQLKSKILSRIAEVPGAQFSVHGSENGKTEAKVVELKPRQSQVFKYVAAVAIVFMSVAVVDNRSLTRELQQAKDELASVNEDRNAMRIALRQSDSFALALQDEIALLSKPGMKSIELKGMDVAPDAKAMAYANTNTGEVYLEIMNLPVAPAGMQYQFWGIVDDKPVDAGMIPLEGDLSGIHPMTTVPNANAYAISLEPKGGSQQPTGKIYVMGTP